MKSLDDSTDTDEYDPGPAPEQPAAESAASTVRIRYPGMGAYSSVCTQAQCSVFARINVTARANTHTLTHTHTQSLYNRALLDD